MFSIWLRDYMRHSVYQLRDLLVIVGSDLSWNPQIKASTSKARKKLHWCLAFLAPTAHQSCWPYENLKYWCPLWNPCKIFDIQELEWVLRTFTCRIAWTKHLSSLAIGGELKDSIMSLEHRRERYILLHLWKICHRSVRNDLRVSFVSRPLTSVKDVVPPLRSMATAYHLVSAFAVMWPRIFFQ
jgi:hypothetical protein